MRSVYLLTAGIALAAVLNFLSVTSKSGHFKSTGSQNSERKARDTRPFKFRVLQALSSHSQTLGWWLRECMYVRMKDDFKDNGLRISDLNYAAAWFTKPNTVSKDGIQKVIPKMIPPQNADRYVVLPIGNGAFERKRSFPAKNAEEIRSKLESVAKDALNLLSLHVNPKKYFYFAPRSDAYHVTLFHTSALEDPRPLPVADLQKEVQTIAQFAKQNEEPIILTLRDIILARSGTLLAAWNVEAGGANIERVRADIWKKFPYAPSGQTQRILHTSLLRLICFEKCDEENSVDWSAVYTGLEKIKERHQIRGSTVTFRSLVWAGCQRYFEADRMWFECPMGPGPHTNEDYVESGSPTII